MGSVTIAFRSEFLSLPDADGNPLGTDATLFLSQLVWLSETKGDEKGWFSWSTEQCSEETGLTRGQQQNIRKRLAEAGYIQRDRRGENGIASYRLCRDRMHPHVQPDASPRATEAGMRRDASPRATEKVGMHPHVQPDASPRATEARAVSIKTTKTPEENLPPIYPPSSSRKGRSSGTEPPEFIAFYAAYPRKEARPKACQAWKRLNPDAETIRRLMAGLEKAKRDWKASGEPEFIPYPATWLNNRRWEDEGLTLDFSQPRGSPPRNGYSPPVKTPEERSRGNREFLERMAKENGYG